MPNSLALSTCCRKVQRIEYYVLHNYYPIGTLGDMIARFLFNMGDKRLGDVHVFWHGNIVETRWCRVGPYFVEFNGKTGLTVDE